MEFLVFAFIFAVVVFAISFMRGLYGTDREDEKQTIKHESVIGRIRASGEYAQEVVGESHYQTALEFFVESTGDEHGPWETDAVLRPENDNPYDNQAVAVFIGPKKVGHLSKESARRYRKLLASSNQAIGNYEVGAKVFGGRNGKSYGVWLDLDIG